MFPVRVDWGSRILLLALLFTGIENIQSHQEFEQSKDSTIFTDQWAVHVNGGDRVADDIAARHGFINFGKIFGDYYHFKHKKVAKRSIQSSPLHHNLLATDPEIRWAEQQVVKRRVKRGNPLDQRHNSQRHRRSVSTNIRSIQPVISNLNDPGWIHMWYLNRGNGRDLNVQEAWAEGITGKGSVVTILDDGLEKNHPDITRNYDPRASFDFNDQDEDPSPRYDIKDSNRHGTRCAGEVAAQGNNSICAVGIAFDANVGGIRMLDGDVTDAIEARSLSYNSQYIDIYSASWGPDDDGKTVDGPGALATRAFIEGVMKGRGGKGSIFVWASGNGGSEHDNCNCDGYTNSIWTLSISSATENGSVPWYSESCSSTLATTYSSGGIGQKQIITTDLHNSCTPSHTGTSAAAPLAAGICALALEANRNLTWRDMQHIVVRTARPDHLKADDWQVNGAGRKVSHSFGYGLMDAAAMVRLARVWKSVPPQQFCEIPAPSAHNSHISPQRSIKLPLTLVECPTVNVMEHVQALVTLTSMNRSEIEIHLTSPAGTRSTLLVQRPLDTSRNGFHAWPFMSVHFWDENPLGVWNIEIHNHGRFHAKLVDWTLIIYGTNERQGRSKLDSVTSSTNSTSLNLSVPSKPQQNAQLLQQDQGKSDGSLVLNRVRPSFVNAEKDRGADLLPIAPELPQPLKMISAKVIQACELGFYSWKNECLSTCPNSSYPVNRTELDRSLSGVCVSCHYSCLFCSGPSDSECTSCYPDSQLKPVSTPGSNVKPELHCFPNELVKELTTYEQWSIGVELALAVNLALVVALVVYMICKKKSCDPWNINSGPITKRKGNYCLLTSSSRENDDNANILTSVIPGAAIQVELPTPLNGAVKEEQT